MINSMTGFGRAELLDGEKKYTVELKSVNHKYLDLGIKMPRKFNAFESEIRLIFKEYASRGKVDIFISYEDQGEGSNSIKYNPALAKEYLDYYRAIRDEFELVDDIKVSLIAKAPDVITLEEQELDEKEVFGTLSNALREAFSKFAASRAAEGEALKNNILEKLDEMDSHVDFIEGYLPSIVAAFRTKLEERVKELLEDDQIDDGRIAAEVTMYADKIAVDEELVRLRTHIKHMRDILVKGGEIGRNLDFIAQEMNRESNTILSKSNDIDVTNRGIELKTCIEKIREQVQNIE